ncbi:hypothetical protein ACOMHN_053714 [Nucella lapillus]
MLGMSPVYFPCDNTPMCACVRFVLLFMPEMAPGRKQHNFYMTGIWMLNILSYINATFNFLIYYTMGSRYRQTLRSLPCCRWCWSGKTHTGDGGKKLGKQVE